MLKLGHSQGFGFARSTDSSGETAAALGHCAAAGLLHRVMDLRSAL